MSCTDLFNVHKFTMIHVDTFSPKIYLILLQISENFPPSVDTSPLRARFIFRNYTTSIVKLDLMHTHPIALTAQPNCFVDLFYAEGAKKFGPVKLTVASGLGI